MILPPIAWRHLRNGLASVTANGGGGSTIPDDPGGGGGDDPGGGGGTNLPLVTPLSAQKIHENYGIAAHPTFNTSVYKTSNVEEWMDLLVSMGITYFRGGFDRNSAPARNAVIAARARGLKWLMIVVPEATDKPTNATVAQTKAQVDWIAAYAPDVCWGIEGLNEPNQNRGSGTTTAGWPDVTFNHQKAIYDQMHSTTTRNVADAVGGSSFNNKARFEEYGVLSIGPSLHDTKAAANNGQHYKDLANTGIEAYFDIYGTHRYPGGDVPENLLDQRLGLIRNAFGADVPIMLTEYGWHNALNTPKGHRPAPEDVSSTYSARSVFLIAGKRGMPMVRYELLDDHDEANPLNDDEQEAHFGVYRIKASIAANSTATSALNPDNWTPKPEATKLKSILQALKDPGNAYTTEAVRLRVDAPTDVKWVVTQKRDGTTALWIWRDLAIWNPSTKTRIPVGLIDVTVTDARGARTVTVGPDVVRVDLRTS